MAEAGEAGFALHGPGDEGQQGINSELVRLAGFGYHTFHDSR